MRYFISIAAMSLLLGSAFWFSGPPQRSPAALPIEPELNYDSFLRVINRPSIKTVEQALAALREQYPNHMSYYTLAYDSRSIQKSSYQAPRALVFGPKANFIYAFNGDPTLPGYNSIETVEFKNNEYSLREVIFKAEPENKNILEKQDIAYQTENLIVSHTDPSKCSLCHGFGNTKPIWEPYFLWPGFYGSNNDAVFSTDAFVRLVRREEPSNEKMNFDLFNSISRFKGRYSQLPPLNSAADPYGAKPNGAPHVNDFLTSLFVKNATKQMLNQLFASKSAESLSLALFTITSCAGWTGEMSTYRFEDRGLKLILDQVIPNRLASKLNPYINEDRFLQQFLEEYIRQAKINLEDLRLMNKLEEGKLQFHPEHESPVESNIEKYTLSKSFYDQFKDEGEDLVKAAWIFQGNVTTHSLVVSRFLSVAGGLDLSGFAFANGSSMVMHDGRGDTDLIFELKSILPKKYEMRSWAPFVAQSEILAFPKPAAVCAKLVEASRLALEQDPNL